MTEEVKVSEAIASEKKTDWPDVAFWTFMGVMITISMGDPDLLDALISHLMKSCS